MSLTDNTLLTKKLFEDEYGIRDEVLEVTKNLIKTNTSNSAESPGNETPAAIYLSDYLEKTGLECQILEPNPGRSNLITHYGEGEPTLILLSHLDVVPADAERWSEDPFSGKVKDGYLWGRGTIDCKSLVACQAVSVKMLSETNFEPKGKIIFAATADEEMGGKYGVEYLLNNHSELILPNYTNYILSETPTYGLKFKKNGRYIFPVEAAEKGISWIKIHVKGKPNSKNYNPIVEASKIILDIDEDKPRIQPNPLVKNFLNTTSKERGFFSGLLTPLLTYPIIGDLMLNMYFGKGKEEEYYPKNIISYQKEILERKKFPNTILAGEKENKIPYQCSVNYDGIQINIEGKPGHASMPGRSDNPIIKTAKFIVKTDKYKFLREVGKKDQELVSQEQKEKEAYKQLMSAYLNAVLTNTKTPTIISGNNSGCVITYDCRTLPLVKTKEIINEFQKITKNHLEFVDFEIIHSSPYSESSTNTPLFREIKNTLKTYVKNSKVFGFMIPGTTDMRFFRYLNEVNPDIKINAYGFQPIISEIAYQDFQKMVHGIDERIEIDNLVGGFNCYYSVVRNFMGK